MIVSWNWLKEYLDLDGLSADAVAHRLMMAGLNHESTHAVGDDLAIDLEVTSNRPDCLGHLGIAREAAVLFDRQLHVPKAAPQEVATPVASLTGVELLAPELCYRYTARLVRGVKIASSPPWLTSRLRTIGIASINNVVDITNYVLMECGQPLHAFDFAKLRGERIIVRESLPGETFLAIDHRTYHLDPGACVIADAQRPVALGGVMGGADTEVSPTTRDVLIESAQFAPMSIRTTARRLNLHSPSSYRFERGVDPEGVDWASRRCCELLLDLAGGEMAEGVIDVGRERPPRPPIVLRLAQIKRVLGIEIEPDTVRRILAALGCLPPTDVAKSVTRKELAVVPPSWRRDLTREIDLIEEAARIYGYDRIPEDVGVAMVASARSHDDRVLDKIRRTLVSAGFDEAMTISAVDPAWPAAFSPWTAAAALRAATPVLRRADTLRLSLVPSLLDARRTNQALANSRIELFEIAKVYLPRAGQLPDEQRMLTLTSGGDYHDVKGALEAILAELNPAARLEAVATRQPLLDAASSAELRVSGTTIGYLGEVSAAGLKQFDLRGRTTIAELRLEPLIELALPVRRAVPLSPFPGVSRDLNVELAETVRWAEVETLIRQSGGPLLESVEFREDFRERPRVPEGRKRLLFTIFLRAPAATLTREEADAIRDQIVAILATNLGGQLVV